MSSKKTKNSRNENFAQNKNSDVNNDIRHIDNSVDKPNDFFIFWVINFGAMFYICRLGFILPILSSEKIKYSLNKTINDPLSSTFFTSYGAYHFTGIFFIFAVILAIIIFSNRISLQNYFKYYNKIFGITATLFGLLISISLAVNL